MKKLTFRSAVTALATCTAVMSFGFTGLAFADAGVPLLTPFELDGDAVVNHGAADWQSLGIPPANGYTGIVSDKFNDATDNNFSQGGSKDERDISSAGITSNFWLGTMASPPDKDDLEHAYAKSYNITNNSGGTDKVIYFGADRFSNNGDAAIGFWFFTNAVSFNPATGKFTGVHSDGDILVTSDFRQGGGVSVLNVFVWQGTADPANPLKLLQSSDNNGGKADQVTGVFCLNPVAPLTVSDACAISNTAPVTAPWSYSFKGVGSTNSFPQGTFFEGGINIRELLGKNECFASFLAMTRTSASTTAQLKDFVIGNFEACNATLRTDIHDAAHNVILTAPAQSTVHDKVYVTGEINQTAPTGNVTFRFFTYPVGANNTTCDPALASSVTSETVALTTLETAPDATTRGVMSAETTGHTLAGGLYSFDASYGGDGTYPAAGPSACEPLTVNTQPVTVTTDIQNASNVSVLDKAVDAGTTIHDVATITGNLNVDPTGSVKFTRYPSADCTGTGVEETRTIVADGVADGTAKVSSTSVTTSATAGNFFSYTADYSGDSNYSPASSAPICEPICSFKTTTQQQLP